MGAKQYISEDFETLLIQKSFEQLLPEEKTFVLQHVQGQEEYDQLRQLFFQVIELGQEEDDLVPDPKVKQHLDKLFEAKSSNSVPWYRQPLFWSGISGIAALFVFAFFWLNRQENSPQLMADIPIVQKENSIKFERDSKQEDPSSQNNQIQIVTPEANRDCIAEEAEEVNSNLAEPVEKIQAISASENLAIEQDYASVTSADNQPSPLIEEEKTKDLGVAKYRKGNDVLIAEIQVIMTEMQAEKKQKNKTSSQETATLKKEADTKFVTTDGINSGKYFFQIKVNEYGKLQDIIIVKSPNPDSEWDKKILKQIKRQIGPFQTPEINGKPVPSEIIIPVQVDIK